MYGEYLPKERSTPSGTSTSLSRGLLSTPVGGGIRSLNVALRKELEPLPVPAAVPVHRGRAEPRRAPEQMQVVIFRENTEDVYAGIEWAKDTPEAKKMIEFLKTEFKITVRPDSGIGVKPMSQTGSKRLVRAAIKYALKHKAPSVTIMHKGNIMKYTGRHLRPGVTRSRRRQFAT